MKSLTQIKSLFKTNAVLTGCVGFLLLLLSACGLIPKQQDSGPQRPVDLSYVTDAIPKPEPKSPYGNPKSYEQDGITYTVLDSPKGYKERGDASWYGTKFHGERTSSGENYDMYAMTAAHKTLPLPTFAKVTNLANGKSVIVRINDRGPFKEGRIIDLSYAAAYKLGFHLKGTTQVEVETIVPEGTHEVVSVSEVPKGHQIYVQVGAFSNTEKAEKLRQAIKSSIPWDVYLSPVKRNRITLHRLRVGPLPSLEVASQLVQTLDIPELGTPKIITE